jgi:hypothetical protein
MPCKEAHVYGRSFMKIFNSLKLPASRSLISIKQLSWGFYLTAYVELWEGLYSTPNQAFLLVEKWKSALMALHYESTPH